MKFRQHIRVYGYPEALKEILKTTKKGVLDVEGIGKINVVSESKAKQLNEILCNKGIKCNLLKSPDKTRPRYLIRGNGLHKAVRGRKYKGDILYTVEANDERELLDKRDAVIEELKTLNVPYEDVCKWVCESAPKTPAKKMFKQKQQKVPEDIHKLKNKVEDLQDTIDRIEKKNIKKTIDQERKAREGVLT